MLLRVATPFGCHTWKSSSRFIHFQPKCLNITEKDAFSSPLTPIEKAFCIAAFICKPTPSAHSNPFAAKIQGAFEKHKSALLSGSLPKSKEEESTESEDVEVVQPSEEANRFADKILREYEAWIGKNPTARAEQKKPLPKPVVPRKKPPAEFGFVPTDPDISMPKRMGARHLFNVLVEHPGLLVHKDFAALFDEMSIEERAVLHVFSSEQALKQYTAAHKLSAVGYSPVPGFDLVTKASYSMFPVPTGIRLHTSMGSAYISILELAETLATRRLRNLLVLANKQEASPGSKLSKMKEELMNYNFYTIPSVNVGSDIQRVLLTVDGKQLMPLFGDLASAEFFVKGLETHLGGGLKEKPEVIALTLDEFPDALENIDGLLFQPLWDEVPGEPSPLILNKSNLAWLNS